MTSTSLRNASYRFFIVVRRVLVQAVPQVKRIQFGRVVSVVANLLQLGFGVRPLSKEIGR